MVTPLETKIAQCSRCLPLEGSIVEDWLPISYFGRYRQANCAILSINPSHREFVDGKGHVLTGDDQRFRRLADFKQLVQRKDMTADQVKAKLDYQDTVFDRAPYKQYFNRLGKFLIKLHGADLTDDLLTPFRNGVTSRSGQKFLYSHLDIVKCATQTTWRNFVSTQQATMIQNCANFLEEQLCTHDGLRFVLINGGTAFNQCNSLLAERFGFAPVLKHLDLGHTSCKLWLGDVDILGRVVKVVGWSSNVVNQPLRATAVDRLITEIRAACPDLS